jgi:glycosyltransferase involved in cell wall biosynthesis
MISVLILSWNESANLPGCLESLRWCDDIHVLDSGSTDETAAIAQAAGCTFHVRAFDNYAAQRNAGLALPFRHRWILIVDADERTTPELAAELQRVAAGPETNVALYRVRRKDMFLGRWLRRSSGYPTWFGRFVVKGAGRYEREINEELFVDGPVGLLREHLTHQPFNKGIAYWFERHNRYSTLESAKLAEELATGYVWRNHWSRDPSLRRKAFKQFAYRMPARPLGAFCYLYFFRFGFLDGMAGLRFALMRACYEFMIDLKTEELRRRKAGQPV